MSKKMVHNLKLDDSFEGQKKAARMISQGLMLQEEIKADTTKSGYIVYVNSFFLRNQQICNNGNVKDENAWQNIYSHALLGYYEWNDDDREGLLSHVAQEYNISKTIISILKI